MNHSIRILVIFGFVFTVIAEVVAGTDNWVIAPQLCSGRAYSDAAKEANWKYDQEQQVSFASVESKAMFLRMLPGEASSFMVDVKLRMPEDTQCRLTVGESIINLRKMGARIQLLNGDRVISVDHHEDSGGWTQLSVARRDGKVSARIHGVTILELVPVNQTIESISLQSTRGTIAVSNYVITGDLQKRESTMR